MFTAESCIVRNLNTSIDQDATVMKFAEELSLYVDSQEKLLGEIHEAVHAVFDQYPGAGINMPALVGKSVQILRPSIKDHVLVCEAVRKYVQLNSKDDGAFVITKGRGDNRGVRRICDIPVTK